MDVSGSQDTEEYVAVREAAGKSGLEQDYIRWVADWPVDDHPEVGDVPMIRSQISSDGALKVHLGDVLAWAGALADSNIRPRVPRNWKMYGGP